MSKFAVGNNTFYLNMYFLSNQKDYNIFGIEYHLRLLL